MLILGDGNPSRLLEDRFIIPARIDLLQDVADPVVLADPQRLMRRQRDVLVRTEVACIKKGPSVNDVTDMEKNC